MWKALGDEEKEPFEAQFTVDNEKYRKELVKYDRERKGKEDDKSDASQSGIDQQLDLSVPAVISEEREGAEVLGGTLEQHDKGTPLWKVSFLLDGKFLDEGQNNTEEQLRLSRAEYSRDGQKKLVSRSGLFQHFLSYYSLQFSLQQIFFL